MKAFLIALTLVSAVVLISPASASAATNAGVKPGSFWYSFDLAFEKINLFFTFNSEGKARKALEYADERLAEAEAVAENNNTDAVKTAISNYKSNIAFAAEKAKDVEEKEEAESLLTSIADSTSKHQEILNDVLAKVPDEAKEAIVKAIEVSKKGQEEAVQKITELKGEVERLKQEVAESKARDKEREKVIEELSRQQSEPVKVKAEKAREEAEEVKRKIAEDNIRKQQEEQAGQLKQQNLLSCNGKNWSPCPVGQKFYCPATGDAQCLIENTQTSSATSRLKYCLQFAAEPENYKDPCDDPTYTETQKAFCGLVTGGLRTSPSTRLSDCLGAYHPPVYSPPPAYSPPSYTPYDYSSSLPSAGDMIKESDEWWENYRQEELNKTVCEGIGKNYYGPLGCR